MDKRELLNLADIDKFDEVFMANLSPRKSPDNRDEWLNSWESFKNINNLQFKSGINLAIFIFDVQNYWCSQKNEANCRLGYDNFYFTGI